MCVHDDVENRLRVSSAERELQATAQKKNSLVVTRKTTTTGEQLYLLIFFSHLVLSFFFARNARLFFCGEHINAHK